MISRRAFFTFLAGGAALLAVLWPWRRVVAQPTLEPFPIGRSFGISYARAFKQCEMIERRMAQDFSGLPLKGADLIWRATPHWLDEYGWRPSVSLGWKMQVNGAKYGNYVQLVPEDYLGRWTGDPTQKLQAKRLIEVLQDNVDRNRRRFASRLA